MTRRRLLLRGLATLALLALGVGEKGSAPGDTALAAILRSLFRDGESVRNIGARCLAALGGSHSRASLTALAGLETGRREWTAALVREQLARQREVDLREGHVIVLEGWFLARSEAAVLALAARG